MKKIFIIILLLLSLLKGVLAQGIPIGEWRDYLPYSDAVSVTVGEELIYCATNSALFTYNKSDFTINRLNLVNGLSDIGLSKVKYNPSNKKVIIAYINGNIDIIDENKNIINLSFIKNSNVSGSKKINHIFLQGKLAYLSTGFGIVVLDTDKSEIADTYFFGALGSSVFTNAVTMDNVNIYAATDQGVFFADKNSFNLNDFNAWSLLTDLGTQKYKDIVFFSNRLFVGFDSPNFNSDTIYYNDSGIWQKFISNGLDFETMSVSNNVLSLSLTFSILLYDNLLTNFRVVNNVDNDFFIRPKETIIDVDGVMWYAESSHGLIKSKSNNENEVITPNGPLSNNVFNMDIVDGDLWKVVGSYNISSFTPNFLRTNMINYKIDGVWKNVGEQIDDIDGGTAFDAVNVAINPSDKSQVFIGTWNNGLFELNNGVVSKIFTAQNSSLDSTFFGSTQIPAIAYDKNNNLWITSSSKRLSVITPEGMQSVELTINGVGGVPTSLIISNNDWKWIGWQNTSSILVYDDNNTLDNFSDDRFVINENIPGSRLYSVVEDQDGEIWLGTDEGVAVFYNPTAIFDENIEAEQIFLQQDGQTQILLETEVVNVITIDGANRKWIGTQKSGAFLMNEDGTEEVEHFTTENSPLFSNNILDIVIDRKTGEVYMATDKGLLSYKGTATEGNGDYSNIFVYPNPVKPDFTGTIAIRGLVENTDVRITDISGNIVFQTTSLGGQAIWDGKDFNGNKVQTGVYMIFNGSLDGNQKAAAKILIYH